MSKALDYLKSQNPLLVGGAVILTVGGLYFIGRFALSEIADLAGGIASGKNRITKGTPYEGAGIVGTLAGSADAISGGSLSSGGAGIGETLFGWFNSDPSMIETLYDVRLPSGEVRKVNAATVSKSGQFTIGGVRYVLSSQRGRDGIYTAKLA